LPPNVSHGHQDESQSSSAEPWREKNLPPTPSGTFQEPDHAADQLHQQQHALIVDGSALKILLDDQEARKDLIRLSDVCFSVICCRASPLQKALVVELIRRGKKTVCLAIGDGANDVSMIQAANIGVGIAGQEGMQAAMASDYSITQFRFIRKLVLVHGHWGYMRIAEMILNFFFKNVLWVASVLWFQIYCG
jgi:magnesium-transporting ATPase (P-type)